MSGFCVRVHSPPSKHPIDKNKEEDHRHQGSSKKTEACDEFMDLSFNCFLRQSTDDESSSRNKNRVMFVIDSNPESKVALEWALSHTVKGDDTIILLYVAKQDGKFNGEIDEKAHDLLRTSKSMCHLKRPEVRVEIAIREGKDKGRVIVEAAKQQKVSLLVLGHQKQNLLLEIFLNRICKMISWSENNIYCINNSRTVDHCIQNSNCMTIAVRRSKNKKRGEYFITTKRHKRFWLLA